MLLIPLEKLYKEYDGPLSKLLNNEREFCLGKKNLTVGVDGKDLVIS